MFLHFHAQKRVFLLLSNPRKNYAGLSKLKIIPARFESTHESTCSKQEWLEAPFVTSGRHIRVNDHYRHLPIFITFFAVKPTVVKKSEQFTNVYLVLKIQVLEVTHKTFNTNVRKFVGSTTETHCFKAALWPGWNNMRKLLLRRIYTFMLHFLRLSCVWLCLCLT